MRKKISWLKIIMAFIITGIVLSGCAAIQKSESLDTEELLSAAGFDMHLANTPEKVTHLKTLPQLKLVSHQKNNNMYYTYADAKYSNALYVGDEQDYKRYKNLSEEEHIAEMQENAAEMEERDWYEWRAWGPIW